MTTVARFLWREALTIAAAVAMLFGGVLFVAVLLVVLA